MKKNQQGSARRSLERIAESFDEISPEELDEAAEELRALGLDPSTVGDKLEQLVLKSIRGRMLREHSDALRARVRAQIGIDLTSKLN
ncbi:MAG TPA: hypothetical protein VJX23_07445 [Candidatus Binataceae bacterium]|nr:hypothetical protein [Candidatus Binataceae bacterium]